MRIHRSATHRDGTRFPIETLQDGRLSWAARGLLVDLLIQDDGWPGSADDIACASRKARGEQRGQGRRAIRALFAELERYGYMVRIETRDTKGRLVTELHVYNTPQHGDAGPPARRDTLAKYPRGEYLYRHWDAEQRLLYVGIASKPSRREQQHAKSSPWMVFYVRTTLERFDTRNEVEAAEAAVIGDEGPLFNVAGNDTPEARRRLVEYLTEHRRMDLLAPAVTRG